jgi:hypothetical protein
MASRVYDEKQEQNILFIREYTNNFSSFPNLLYNTTGGGEIWSPLITGADALTEEQVRKIIAILTPKQLECLYLYAKEEKKLVEGL